MFQIRNRLREVACVVQSVTCHCHIVSGQHDQKGHVSLRTAPLLSKPSGRVGKDRCNLSSEKSPGWGASSGRLLDSKAVVEEQPWSRLL